MRPFEPFSLGAFLAAGASLRAGPAPSARSRGGNAPNALPDSFTSGGSTSIAPARASATWSTTLSVFEASLEMSAAMNSTG